MEEAHLSYSFKESKETQKHLKSKLLGSFNENKFRIMPNEYKRALCDAPTPKCMESNFQMDPIKPN